MHIEALVPIEVLAEPALIEVFATLGASQCGLGPVRFPDRYWVEQVPKPIFNPSLWSSRRDRAPPRRMQIGIRRPI